MLEMLPKFTPAEQAYLDARAVYATARSAENPDPVWVEQAYNEYQAAIDALRADHERQKREEQCAS